MTKLDRVIFVCLVTGGGAAMEGAGCSSSSNSATPAANDAGAEASIGVGVKAGADGAVTHVTLQWAVASVTTLPVVAGPDGGSGEASEAGAGEAGTSEGGIDAGALDAGAPDAGEIEDGGEPVVSDAGGDGSASLADLPPLAGVQVCIYQNSAIPCVTTQADGTFSLPGLPTGRTSSSSSPRTATSPLSCRSRPPAPTWTSETTRSPCT
jgi:hypothetical protein